MKAEDSRMDELRLWSILEDEKEKKNRSIIKVLKKVRDEQAEISFKAGKDEEYKKWVKAFMGAGIMIAEADKVCIAIEETKRAGIREVLEYRVLREPHKTYANIAVTHLQIPYAKLKDWGIDEQ